MAAATAPASASEPVTAETNMRQPMDRMAIGIRPTTPHTASVAASGDRSNRK
ncbi:hypothetical protein [Streptomyces sp. NPDC014744]|uniref:hypothetical protein n=1 Tax=Streptomyces sp. NPDC014744 TaxID=3364903 RepID=UPI0036F733E7